MPIVEPQHGWAGPVQMHKMFTDGTCHSCVNTSEAFLCVQAPTSKFSGATGTTPMVMTGEPKGNADLLGNSDVYSPLGSSAHEVGLHGRLLQTLAAI